METLEQEFQREYEEHKIRLTTEYLKRFEISKDIDYDIMIQNIPMFLKYQEIRNYYSTIYPEAERQTMDMFLHNKELFEEMYKRAYETIEGNRLM